jgi:HD domain
MERHTVRQYLIAERLAETGGITFDRELLLCASFLHDAGLYGPASTGDVYIKDSVRYARRTLEPLGWPEDRLRVCLDACEQHHAFTARWSMATRSSSSAGPTSSKCCPSSRGSASLAPGSSASCGRRSRAPASGPPPCRSLVRTGGECSPACFDHRHRRELRPEPPNGTSASGRRSQRTRSFIAPTGGTEHHCCLSRHQPADTKRTHQKRHARRPATHHQGLNRSDLQGKLCRK